MTPTRTRYRKAERRQKKMISRWSPGASDGKKWVKCGLCKGRFVVNNYDDGKIRISQHKVGGVIVCPWCNTRYGKGVVQLLKIAQKVADYSKLCRNGDDENCKCDAHVAKRILIANNWLETGRKKK